MKPYDVSILIPVFNSEASLPSTFFRLDSAIANSELTVETIFVDDGSKDKSFELLRAYKEGRKNVRVIKFTKNFGLHTALFAGFELASAPIVITMEAHLEHEVSDAFRLLTLLNSDVDLVSARRINRLDPWWRILASKTINFVLRATCGVKIHDFFCLLKAWRREAGLQVYCDPSYSYVLAVGCKIKMRELDVDFSVSHKGYSSFSFSKLFSIAIELLKTIIFLHIKGTRSQEPLHRTQYEIELIL